MKIMRHFEFDTCLVSEAFCWAAVSPAPMAVGTGSAGLGVAAPGDRWAGDRLSGGGRADMGRVWGVCWAGGLVG